MSCRNIAHCPYIHHSPSMSAILLESKEELIEPTKHFFLYSEMCLVRFPHNVTYYSYFYVLNLIMVYVVQLHG